MPSWGLSLQDLAKNNIAASYKVPRYVGYCVDRAFEAMTSPDVVPGGRVFLGKNILIRELSERPLKFLYPERRLHTKRKALDAHLSEVRTMKSSFKLHTMAICVVYSNGKSPETINNRRLFGHQKQFPSFLQQFFRPSLIWHLKNGHNYGPEEPGPPNCDGILNVLIVLVHVILNGPTRA